MFKFLDLINDQATVFQWSNKLGVMMIPEDVSDANMDYVSLLTNHGEFNLNIITKF